MLGKTNIKPQPKYYKRYITNSEVLPLAWDTPKPISLDGIQPGTYVAQFMFDTDANGSGFVYNYSSINGVAKGGWQQTGLAPASWPIFVFTVTPAQATAGVNAIFQLGGVNTGTIIRAECYIRRIG